MSQVETGQPAPPINQVSATFPPVYYDSPVTIMVLGVEVAAPDLVTATITAGAPYFTVSQVVVSVPLKPPLPGPGGEGPPHPSLSGGNRPPVVESIGQSESAKLFVTVNVPAGAGVPLGALTGTAELVAKTVAGVVTARYQVKLNATLLGTIIGKVSVQPETVAPGQPVQIEVLNTLGEPISDPAVTVTVQGVHGASRWEQYATAGTRTLSVVASNGTRTDTGQGSVTVSGTPLEFTLDPPSIRQLPIIEARIVPGQPYAGSFTLGTPRSVFGVPVTATPVKMTAATAVAAPAAAAPPVAGHVAAGTAKQTVAEPVRPIAPIAGGNAAGVLAAGSAEIPGAPVATSYAWDFGDGSPTVTTQSPTVTHDFFPAISGDAVTHSFDVSCTAVHDNVTVKRTIVLHSAYGICKQTGVVVPPVTGAPAYAPLATTSIPILSSLQPVTVPLDGFSASMIVHNLEPSPLVLQSMAIVPMSDDPGVAPPAPVFTSMATPQEIAANSASALGAFVPFSALSLGGPPANAFALYYLGVTNQNEAANTAMSACFSVIFRIPATYSGLTTSTSSGNVPVWDRPTALGALMKVTAATAGTTTTGSASVDPATRTITVPLSSGAHDTDTVIQATSTIRAGLASIAAAQAAIVKDDVTIHPTEPPPVAPGNPCYPDDISDADAASASAQQLVCQLTPGPPQTVTIPAAFQNAQAGDVILSPAPTGDGDLIAAMFQALTPSQHHGHSGIMTANFYEITHCTASVARIAANVNTDAVGIPTSLNGQMLQYGWPGSITQTIDEATNSVPWTAPEGATYSESSFNFDDRGNPQQLIHPIVVKPLPGNEQMARPKLRQAADLARSKGAQYASQFNQPTGKTPGEQLSIGGCYYSFYNYTKPQISAGFTDPAPAAGGWAQGMSPAVCSAFVWMCMKETGIPCVSTKADESLSDFTAAALATGQVAVSPDANDPTLDGLIYYSEHERQAGATALYDLFMQQALSKEGGFGTFPGVNDTVAGPLADQLLNCFAFGNPNMVNDSSWQNPGVGNAVSPDNIRLWSPPYFGYAEPLQYLPSHTGQYTPSAWVRVTTHGTISGKVTRGDTGAPVAGALVWANLNVNGMYAHTGADGSYTLPNVPLGTYALKASATLTVGPAEEEFTNLGVNYTLTSANNGNGVRDLVISGPLITYRQINVHYQISCDHGDLNLNNAHGVQINGPYSRSLYVNPGHQTDSFTYTYDYNNGGYFHCSYTFTAALLEDGATVMVTVEGAMYDDGSGNEQTNQALTPPATITAGGSGNWWIDMENTGFGYHNGPARFTFSMENVQQTG